MRIEDITKQRLLDASDLELKQLRFKFTKFWDRHFKSNSREVVGCFTRNDFVAKYRLLLKEADSSNRSLQSSTCDIDRQAFKQSMQAKADGIDIAQLSSICLQKNCVLLNTGFVNADTIDIIVQSDSSEPVELMEAEITKIMEDQFNKPCEFTYDKDFEGDAIPLFHQVLRPVDKIEKIEIKSEDNKVEKSIEFIPLEKADQQIVYGIVYEPDTKDAQGDQASAEEIKKAAYDFMENAQAFKVMHKGKRVKVRILENYIAPVDFTIAKRNVKKGSWMLVTRVLDKKLWQDIKDGNLTGYSMAGYARID